MIELDSNGQLPMVGPTFRLSLRSEKDTAFGTRQWFVGVVTPQTGQTQEQAQKSEEDNEFFAVWLTDWFDISESGWQEKAGFSKEALSTGPFLEVGFYTSEYPQRHRGSYLSTCLEVYHNFPYYVRKRSLDTIDGTQQGTWYIPLPEDMFENCIKRYSDTLTKKEQLGSPCRLSLNEILNWYETSRPGGSQTDVATLQRQVAILLEELMTAKENSPRRLEKLSEVELQNIRAQVKALKP